MEHVLFPLSRRTLHHSEVTALLLLRVLISLFQLMFSGCVLREVRTVGRAGAQMTSPALIPDTLE